MAAKEGLLYRVARTSPVNEQIRALAKKAVSAGIDQEFFRAMREVVEQLQTRPLEWGDPERRTRKKGGWVCHGVRPPVIVYYVVYEPERAVCILRVRPLPGSPLE